MLILEAQVLPLGCAGTIPLELAFTKTAFGSMIIQCGEEGILAHTTLARVDYLFIISYVGFAANLLGYLVRGIQYKRALFYFSLPLLAGLINMVENTLLLNQLSDPHGLNEIVIFLASAAALMKFLLMVISASIVLFYLFILISAGKSRST